jgi:hypothetical protein
LSPGRGRGARKKALLRLPAPTPSGAVTRLARVAHATRLPDGGCLVGCRFSPPLTEGELEAVLEQLG